MFKAYTKDLGIFGRNDHKDAENKGVYMHFQENTEAWSCNSLKGHVMCHVNHMYFSAFIACNGYESNRRQL